MDDQPRTAVAISLILKDTLDATLFHLAELEAQGQVRHVTDELGVMRWVMVEPETVVADAPVLGAQKLWGQCFTLSTDQKHHLGFNT